MDSFEKMYASFSLFGKAAKTNNEKFYPLSAGVNWIKSNSAILKLLRNELDSAVSYRNYGNSGGPKIVRDFLAIIERDISETIKKPDIVICNGSSEGSFLIFKYLMSGNYLKEGDETMMISHGFSLYSKLSKQFQLKFTECIQDELVYQSLLAPINKVIYKIEQEKPKLVFLLLPNNPLGERYSDVDLLKLKNTCEKLDIKILIDRVCLMPWDDYGQINKIFMDAIIAGNAFIVDSMSKAESLAGVRTGYIVTNSEVASKIIDYTQYRNLNPIVFSTFTMMVSKMFSMISQFEVDSKRFLKIYELFKNDLFYGYPSNEKIDLASIITKELYEEYNQQKEYSKSQILHNFYVLKETFNGELIRELNLKSGFNVVLSTQKMNILHEKNHQEKLANKYSVGVLTENCFRNSKSNLDHYFLRIGLTIPPSDFEVSISRLKQFYKEL